MLLGQPWLFPSTVEARKLEYVCQPLHSPEKKENAPKSSQLIFQILFCVSELGPLSVTAPEDLSGESERISVRMSVLATVGLRT